MIYFNTAGVGKLYPSTEKVAARFTSMQAESGSIWINSFRQERIPEIRKELAAFFGLKDPNRLLFLPNTSTGINFLVSSIPSTEKISMLESDYPSINLPWHLHDFDTTTIPTDGGADLSAERIIPGLKSSKASVLVASHVHWQTGALLEWEEIRSFCLKEGIVTIIDATQSLGVLPISADDFGADVLMSSGYKWLNAGFGIGVMMLNDSFCDRFPPKTAGYGSVNFDLTPPSYTNGPSGFEPGSPNMLGIEILSDALQTKANIGLNKVHEQSLALTNQFLGNLETLGITPASNSRGSTIVSFKANPSLAAGLMNAGIVHTYREGLVRLSFHHTNTMKEVEELVQILRTLK